MRQSPSFINNLQYHTAAIVLVSVIVVGVFTNLTLRSIEKNMPTALLQQLRDLSDILEKADRAAFESELARKEPGGPNLARLQLTVADLHHSINSLRYTYVFDNLIQASAFHAVVAPAVDDANTWLAEGVSGYGPQTAITLKIVQDRIRLAHEKAKRLNDTSYRAAQQALGDQRQRLDRFLLSVNMLLALTLIISTLMAFLLIRQRRLRAREIEAQEELRRAECSLRESEEKYRLLVDNANDGIFIAQDECIKFPNPRILEILGLQEQGPEPIPFFEFIHPEDRAKVADLHRRRVSGEKNLPETYSFRSVSRNGGEYLVQINVVNILWEGRPATLNFVRDITEQKKMEAHLQQALKLEAVGTLAGGIAHDFNNILMGIQGRVSLMLADVGSSHLHYEHLKGVQSYVKGATDLTRQLLGFAKGGKYEAKPTDINRLITQSADMFGRTHKEIRIFKKLCEALGTVEVDRGQLHQVMLNLYVNAWQAMPEGGDIYLQTENFTADDMLPHPSEIRPGRYVKVSVTDTGTGMDHITKARVFDPFFTTKSKGRGTGLGLASAYGIIQNHGGLIRVYSEPGQGTTFTIYLPASDKAVEPEIVTSAQLIEGNGSILLVDDEEMVLEVACKMLERLGYHVLAVGSGRQAVEIIGRQDKEIDLIILDMVMPEMGGSETFDRIRQIDPAATVLLSSGYSMNGQALDILRRGCSGFIQKPFSLSELSQKIKEVLDLKKVSAPPEG
jgi:two-component system, cell cycle sensor histidine kinase and response regulator CckA